MNARNLTLDATAVNLPSTHSELERAFEEYEDALVHNKVDVLDALFWDSQHTLRYGAREVLFSYEEIKAYRAARPSAGLSRAIVDRHIVTFGDTMGVANVTFRRDGEPRLGRQSQTWVRFEQGWKVVSAHVSWMDP